MSINRVVITGNLTRNPELSQNAKGTMVLKFGIAVNDRVHVEDEWVSRPNFFEVTMFGSRAKSLSNILEKGLHVCLAGRLHWSSWEGQDGQKRSRVEIIADDIEFYPNLKTGSPEAPRSEPVGEAQSEPSLPPETLDDVSVPADVYDGIPFM